MNSKIPEAATDNNSTASAIADIMSSDPDWLSQQFEPERIIDTLEIDNEIQALNISIYLRQTQAYTLADRLLARVREHCANSDLTFYNSAVVAAALRDHERTIAYARRTVSLSPAGRDYRSLLARACAVSGKIEASQNVLKGFRPATVEQQQEAQVLAQFIDYCDLYPLRKAKTALAKLQEAGAYMEAHGVAATILKAVQEGHPFSMVRLGDGEGAWLVMDAYDEGRFGALYRANRESFLEDWFGSRELIQDNSFLRFSLDLQRTFLAHDIIGVPPMERLNMEEGFLSTRGLPSAINVFRYLGLIDGVFSGFRLCSNSINLTLASETSFYQSLFRSLSHVGLITSQRELASIFVQRGITVVKSYIVPGDSRNFHRRPDGIPECQFPEYVSRIDSELASMDLRGIVFLVAAGFVGKRYLRTIRDRGGIAIDIGSIADHWVRRGLPE